MITASKTVTREETISSIFLSVKLENPSVEEVKQAVEALKAHSEFKGGGKFVVTFSEEVRVRRDRFNELDASEIEVNFFTSGNGTFAYTFHRRSGYPLSRLDYGKITSVLYRVAKDAEQEQKEVIEKILKRRYDDQTWSHLTPDSLLHQQTTIVNIKKKFPDYVIKELQEAFENKTKYSYTKYGSKRDLRVSTQVGEDGIFRAWFSSEFAGCGNGQYYILLNPTTASFCEWD